MEQTQIAALKRTNHLKLVWGLVCLIAPTALIIISLLFYAVFNFVFSTGAPSSTECPTIDGIVQGANCFPADDSLFGESNLARTITNVILFIVGVFSVLTWLPGIIVGIILIANRKSIPNASN